MVDVWTIGLDEGFGHEQVAACEKLLGPAERKRADEFRLFQARRQFVVGRAMAKLALPRPANSRAASDWDLDCTPAGKPFVVGGPLFSISHSPSLVAFAMSSMGEIGLDVEPTKRDFTLQSVQKVLSEDESRTLASLVESERSSAFAKIWTAKEAVAKACGRGLGLDFRKIVLLPTTDGYSASGAAGDWGVWQAQAENAHCLAVAMKQLSAPTIHRLDAGSFMAAVKRGSL